MLIKTNTCKIKAKMNMMEIEHPKMMIITVQLAEYTIKTSTAIINKMRLVLHLLLERY